MGLNDLALAAHGVPAGTAGVLFYSDRATGPLPLGNGVRCVGGRVYRLPVGQANGEVLSVDLDLDNPPQASGQITSGSTWVFQVWYRDTAAGGPGFNLSEAVALQFQD